MNISFLGGAREVGGSCILLNIYNKNILLDCGIRQSSSKDTLPDFKSIQDQGGVDVIIVSHAHMDHIGSLPIISKEYPGARIYTTRMTKDLMKVLLYDSLKIMKNREGEIPLYAEGDVISMLNRVFPINYMVEFSIFENIKLTFYTAGHIAGAACIYITTPEGSLFYSGDFSIFSQKTVEGLKVPKLRPDAAIFESTYGDRLHSNREVEEEKLIDTINDCIEKKGKMLIPAFALGRAQEVLLIIKKAVNKNILKDTKVYVDGMIKDINRTYKLNPLYLKNSLGKKILRGIEPFYDDNIIAVDNNKLREEVLKDDEPCVIVSSSGMLTGGYSQYYAEKIAPMENGYIVITGYQDEESPGRKLLNLLDEEKDKKLYINEKTVPVNCKVEKVGLSAHSDKYEIKSLIDFLTPKNIFLVHGNEEVVENLSKELSKDVRGRVYAPRCSEVYEINIKNPRKQWKKNIDKVMNSCEEMDENNVKRLWEFVRYNYGERLFTLEELIFIWKGNNKGKNALEDFQRIIVECPYFESDTRRLFLFKINSEDKVSQSLKNNEIKLNELKEAADKYFNKFNTKKISFICDQKKVILNFDFPGVVDKSIYGKIKKFEEEVKWKVEINNSVNINAVSEVVRINLQNISIKKISYRLGENQVVVMLNSKCNVEKEKLAEIENITGLQVLIQSPGIDLKDSMLIKAEDECEMMEQNKALNIIDETFEREQFRPYKKSIKSNSKGRYIELTFISPIIGKKYEKNIEELVHLTGWNMKVSNSANQNEILQIASILCKSKGIDLKKNPSFNSSNLSVELKLEDDNVENMEDVKKEFEYKTGCMLKW
ncbi:MULTISPECIES: MBL fold metallo-hydrolase [Clostridium]|uniref:MBL fold metallo-hydrolase n=3 Tax=Clostridium TaxID=1485 RepID=A0ABM5NSR3_9CLOT|nr:MULTISPECIES: MBL fold metallo-hydrolase [Clostridium]ADK16262.1 putative metal-dependent RNase [Clostridium ljungdahlii DSM 13528]AGY75368.1 MBL fold metallo-hydrolase [Clostridium autoethanogenum DSM 10061]ALU35533.1 Metal-dependent RNase [Clostridium autoethanogenum DSM 10061]OAA89869.1 Ribonuclease [Clostridium ljungdahlii DSM 13528]OVY52405.1 Ribonuclease [Clostridium autoethanogenum]